MARNTLPRRLPGDGLRAWARRMCSAATLEHVVDPIVADLQHESLKARHRSRFVRAGVWLRGYVAFTTALSLHFAVAAGRHLAENALGTTPEDRGFHRRAGSGTLTALVISTSIVMLYGIVTLTRSAVFIYTHLRWPGAPSVADVLPAALQLATDPRGLLLLVPGLVVMTLPPSLLFGILRGFGAATTPGTLRLRLRSAGVVSLGSALVTLLLVGWVAPEANQRYREFFMASAFSRAVRPGTPARGIHELSLPELQDQARAEYASGRGESSQHYSLEWHGRLAGSVAPLAFGLVALGLVAQPRVWSTRQIGVISAVATFAYYWGLRFAARGVAIGTAVPLAMVWSVDLGLVLLAAALLLRGFRSGTLSPAR
jgi:hypothetical protein